MKRCLVTGSTGGIGLEISRQLAAIGSRLTLVARSESKLQEVAGALPGGNHDCLAADLATEDGINAVAEFLAEQRHDVLVNNAGIGLYGKFVEIDLEQQIKMLMLNCNALVRLSYLFIENARSGDALINIGSLLGETSGPGAAVYAGTKGFVNRLSESLWLECKSSGVYVAAVCPGATATSFHKAAGGDVSIFPKSLTQTPEQVAAVVVRALQRRNKPLIVSGLLNRVMKFGLRCLSRKRVVKMMGRFLPDASSARST